MIYLASQSPRRRELLNQIGVTHTVLVASAGELPDIVTEAVLPGEAVNTYVTRVTLEKLEQGKRLLAQRGWPLCPLLAADTTVTIDGHILGKPADLDEARHMLRRLSGRTHQVLTSIALACPRHPAASQDSGQGAGPDPGPLADRYWEQALQQTQQSSVRFTDLSDADIARYCASQTPYDKAGGYGIQGLAAIFIADLQGSHSGVMGLPLFETAELLKKAGIDFS